MGKSKGAEKRTKGNVQVSSSSRAQEVLEQKGATAAGLAAGGLLTSLTNAISDEVDGDVRMVLRKLAKRDSVTKCKALQDFAALCNSKSETNIIGALPYWCRIYSRLSLDSDRRVRELTNTTLRSVVSVIGRSMAPHLKSIIVSWILSMSDDHLPAASAAKAAFEIAFQPTKQPQVIWFCKEEILTSLEMYILRRQDSNKDQAASLPDLNEVDNRNMILASSLSAFGLFISSVVSHPDRALIEDRIVAFFAQKQFWKLSRHDALPVRLSYTRLLHTVLKFWPTILSSSVAQLFTSIISTDLETPESNVLVWECLLSAISTFKDSHDLAKLYEKALLPKLHSSLRSCCLCLRSVICLLCTADNFPASFTQDSSFWQRLSDSCLDGCKTARALYKPALEHAVLYCTQLFCKNLIRLDVAFCHQLLLENVIPIIQKCLVSPSIHLAAFSCLCETIDLFNNAKSEYMEHVLQSVFDSLPLLMLTKNSQPSTFDSACYDRHIELLSALAFSCVKKNLLSTGSSSDSSLLMMGKHLCRAWIYPEKSANTMELFRDSFVCAFCRFINRPSTDEDVTKSLTTLFFIVAAPQKQKENLVFYVCRHGNQAVAVLLDFLIYVQNERTCYDLCDTLTKFYCPGLDCFSKLLEFLDKNDMSQTNYAIDKMVLICESFWRIHGDRHPEILQILSKQQFMSCVFSPGTQTDLLKDLCESEISSIPVVLQVHLLEMIRHQQPVTILSYCSLIRHIVKADNLRLNRAIYTTVHQFCHRLFECLASDGINELCSATEYDSLVELLHNCLEASSLSTPDSLQFNLLYKKSFDLLTDLRKSRYQSLDIVALWAALLETSYPEQFSEEFSIILNNVLERICDSLKDFSLSTACVLREFDALSFKYLPLDHQPNVFNSLPGVDVIYGLVNTHCLILVLKQFLSVTEFLSDTSHHRLLNRSVVQGVTNTQFAQFCKVNFGDLYPQLEVIIDALPPVPIKLTDINDNAEPNTDQSSAFNDIVDLAKDEGLSSPSLFHYLLSHANPETVLSIIQTFDYTDEHSALIFDAVLANLPLSMAVTSVISDLVGICASVQPPKQSPPTEKWAAVTSNFVCALRHTSPEAATPFMNDVLKLLVDSEPVRLLNDCKFQDQSPLRVVAATTLARLYFYATSVNAGQDLSTSVWDKIRIDLTGWVQTLSRLRIFSPSSVLEVNFTVSSLRLLCSVTKAMTLSSDISTLPVGFITLQQEWTDVFSQFVFLPLLKALVSVAEETATGKSNISSFGYATTSLRKAIFDAVLSMPSHVFEKMDSDEVDNTHSQLYDLLGTSKILETKMIVFVLLDKLNLFVQRQDSVYVDKPVNESKQSRAPTRLFASVEHLVQVSVAHLFNNVDAQDFEDDLCEEHIHYSFVLSWKLFLNFIHSAPTSVKPVLARQAADVIDSAIRILLRLTGDSSPGETPDTSMNGDIRSLSIATSQLTNNVLCSTASELPSIVRQWWQETDKATGLLTEKYFTQYISKLLVIKELDLVSNVLDTGGNLSDLQVKIRRAVGEVVAVYKVEDGASMEMVIALPSNYPLGYITVDSGPCRGASASQWQTWRLQMNALLNHQNGSIVDGLLLWKQNLAKRYEGVEECMICFSVVHATTSQLPKNQCKTCQKKFHSPCLFKWFNISNKSTCPLCRNLF